MKTFMKVQKNEYEGARDIDPFGLLLKIILLKLNFLYVAIKNEERIAKLGNAMVILTCIENETINVFSGYYNSTIFF